MAHKLNLFIGGLALLSLPVLSACNAGGAGTAGVKQDMQAAGEGRGTGDAIPLIRRDSVGEEGISGEATSGPIQEEDVHRLGRERQVLGIEHIEITGGIGDDVAGIAVRIVDLGEVVPANEFRRSVLPLDQRTGTGPAHAAANEHREPVNVASIDEA